MSATRVALITGCSTGVGQALATLLATSSNYRVYATMRNLGKQDSLVKSAGDTLNKNLFIKQLDVCDDNSVNGVVKEIIGIEGKIDILVNNAGVGLSGPIEGFTVQHAKENFETNFFGVYRMTAAVLPHMKEKRAGHIIQLSSMGGVTGVPFNDIYCASKFAVEGFSESLAPMLQCFDIKVTVVEPGPILTDFVTNTFKNSGPGAQDIDSIKVDDKTKEILKKYKEKMMAGFNPAMGETALQLAEKIKAVLEEANPPFRLQTNQHYHSYAKAKFSDPTGNSSIQGSFQRFFA